jgi:hypothetical protein
LSGETIHDSACTLRVFRRKCIQNITVFNGMHRFLSTLVKMEGFRIVEVPVSIIHGDSGSQNTIFGRLKNCPQQV